MIWEIANILEISKSCAENHLHSSMRDSFIRGKVIGPYLNALFFKQIVMCYEYRILYNNVDTTICGASEMNQY